MALNSSDIIKLMEAPSGAARSEIADKVSREYLAGTFNPRERELAHEIFRIMLRDAEARIRRLLSLNLKSSLDLPHDIALTLAKDVEEVSVPMLETSFVLTEEDLQNIVSSTNKLGVLAAIARRETLSAEVVRALLEKRQERVTHTLLVNTGAHLGEQDLMMQLDHIKTSDTLLEALIDRGGFSVQMAEIIYSHVSDEMKRVLEERYSLSRSMAEDLVESAHEDVTLELSPRHEDTQPLQELVNTLHQQDRLSFSLIMRALCQGKLAFFETALAKLADIPLMNAKLLILDPGTLGFKSLYESANLPMGFYPAVKALLEIALEETGYGRYYLADYQKRMVERMMAERYSERVENMDYLMHVIRDDKKADYASFAAPA